MSFAARGFASALPAFAMACCGARPTPARSLRGYPPAPRTQPPLAPGPARQVLDVHCIFVGSPTWDCFDEREKS
jgi:hypothetical protein